MALRAFRADPFTRSELGRSGLEELSRNLWPGLCQTCGTGLDGDVPSVVMVDAVVSVTASLHHARCQEPRWARSLPPGVDRHLTTAVALAWVPFGDPARDPFVPTVVANPGLEVVGLTAADGSYRATTVADYRTLGFSSDSVAIPPGDGVSVACWIGEDGLVVRCGRRLWSVPVEPDGQVVLEVRRRGDVVVGVSSALDPSRLENPEPLKRVLRAGDIALIRVPLSPAQPPVTPGPAAVLVESDFVDARESHDEDWFAETLPYPGPSYDPSTGRFSAGMTMDGHVYWRLNTPGVGVDNGLVVQPPGYGKTSNLRLVLVEALASELFDVAVADPHDRNGLVDLVREIAFGVARTVPATLDLMAAVLAEVDSRGGDGDRYRDPSREHRGLVLLIDDAHLVLADPAAAALAERIATTGPPVGVGLVVASTSVSQAAFGDRRTLLWALTRVNALVPTAEDAAWIRNLRAGEPG